MNLVVRDVTRYVQTTTRVFAAYDLDMLSGVAVGALTVDERDDLVCLVYVREHARRQGVATRMLEAAREQTRLRLAEDIGDRSLQGSRWARAVGLGIASNYARVGEREANGLGARLMIAVPMLLRDLDVVA